MSSDVLVFLAFIAPVVCLIVGWYLSFGKSNGAVEMSWQEVIVIDICLLFLAAVSVYFAVDFVQSV